MPLKNQLNRNVWIGILVVVLLASGLVLQHFRLKARNDLLFSQRTACVGNLTQIHLAKLRFAAEQNLADGRILTAEEILREIKPSNYHCPNGGDYIINPIGKLPQCTYTNIVWRAWRPSGGGAVTNIPYFHALVQ